MTTSSRHPANSFPPPCGEGGRVALGWGLKPANGGASTPPVGSADALPIKGREDFRRILLRWLLAAAYFGFGLFHLASPASFLPIMPPLIPFPREVVLFTGVCELAGAVGLLLPSTRWWAGVMLALYAVCVYPANLYHAFSGVYVPHLSSSWWYHGPRLSAQPVLVWWALYAGGETDWPFRRRTRVAQASRWMREATTKPRER